jgi:GT2 family glycosyltransferase/glycosyltransferase involved in cell wall biosynthesis
MTERVAAAHPECALFVVAEFEPQHTTNDCVWIPWHVPRPLNENLAAIRAALGGRPIAYAAVALAPGTALQKMRWAAVMLAASKLEAYDEDFRRLTWSDLPSYLMREAERNLQSPRAKLWRERLANPAAAEIPLRARAAQMAGLAGWPLRPAAEEKPLPSPEPVRAGVSVIVPSRDGRELLATLFRSLLPQMPAGAGEVIVSDNGSRDGTAAWLAQAHPEVSVIESVDALSFARAVNAGIRAARFSHTLLLNNDMVVEPGFVDALLISFRSVPGLFCATAQIFFPEGVRREETGKAVWRRAEPLDLPLRCDDPYPGEDLTWVLYGSGGCSLFDTAMLRELGGVAEAYDPAYVEDLDLGYRAWKRGWASVYCANARVEHRHRATTARFFSSRQLDFFVERNFLRFLLHGVGDRELFTKLWTEAIRRLQLRAMKGEDAALDALRDVPLMASRPAAASGVLSEDEILALGSGDVAAFPARRATGRERVIVATPYLPFPLSHGGAVRIFNLMRQASGRKAGQDLVLVSFVDELSAPPAELLEICAEVVLVRRHHSHYRIATERPDMVEEFSSATFRAALRMACERWKPRVVQLEFTQMAQYANACGTAKTLLVEHDVTFDLQEQLLASSPDTGAPRWELEQQAAKWRRFETAAWREVDCVAVMSEKDRAVVSGARRAVVLPNGVDCERFQPPGEAPEPKRLLFIGSFAHLPNLLAVNYFLREVWPLVSDGYKLHIIAGARPEYFLEFYRGRVNPDFSGPGIELEAFVSDVRPAYRRASLVLAPLTASAGTNLKVLEAMAMGRVVIGTAPGFNGLDLEFGRDCVLAKDAREFAAAIEDLAQDVARRQSIERAAREAALRFDWRAIGEKQAVLYKELATDERG